MNMQHAYQMPAHDYFVFMSEFITDVLVVAFLLSGPVTLYMLPPPPNYPQKQLPKKANFVTDLQNNHVDVLVSMFFVVMYSAVRVPLVSNSAI